MRTPRHNLKFTQGQKLRFQAPHDVFLEYLLAVVDAKQVSVDITQAILTTPIQGPVWTVWVGGPVFQQFNRFKKSLEMELTNTQCLEVLLFMASHIEALGLAPHFNLYSV